jgi:uncharacterized SAM-binding protein YcdF (DUF218 family)
VYRIVTTLAQPGLLLLFLVVLAVVNLWRKRRETPRRLLFLTIPLILLLLWSTPVVGYLSLGSLEWPYPPLQERPADADVIVVLSGYLRVQDGEGKRVELGGDTLQRCLRAAEVYRQGEPCPILVSGGKPDPDSPGPTLAEAMREFLVQQHVDEDDIIVEDRSRTTFENAVESCRLLDELGLRKMVLVTDGAHMHRAVGCFRKQGADVVPCGCRYRALRMDWSPWAFVPSLTGGSGAQEALHEWLGVAWYALHDRL